MSSLVRMVPALVFCLGIGLSAVRPAIAAQEIVLVSDRFQIVKLPEVPATVIVGNPSVADVTTDGASLFFHPRGYGVTTVIALDSNGAKLGDYEVRVIYEDRDSVAMYSPKGRQTYTCRKDCELAFRVGDEPGHFQQYSGQVDGKSGLANAQANGTDIVTPQPLQVENKTGIAPP